MSEWKTHPEGVALEESSGPIDKANFIDVLIVFAKYKRLIVGLPLIVGLLAAVMTFIIPPQYKATSKLLPPQQAQSATSALLSQLGGVAALATGGGGLKNPNDLYVGMLKSRTVADKLIEQYSLKNVYGTSSQEKARIILAETTTIASGKDGLIAIEVESKDPGLAARLTNSYVDELLRLTRVLAVTEASQRRSFFERQLEQSKDNLVKAEISLKAALDTRGVVSVDTESKAILETGARLRAQVSAKEIQLNSMKVFLTPNNPEYRRAEAELNSLRSEVSKLENGRGESTGTVGNGQAGLENIKLLRDVKYYQMLYELLAKQYEGARLDEAKDPSIIQVLDPALVPERPFKPKKVLTVLLSMFAALVVAVFVAMIREAKARALLEPVSAGKWKQLKSHMRLRRVQP